MTVQNYPHLPNNIDEDTMQELAEESFQYADDYIEQYPQSVSTREQLALSHYLHLVHEEQYGKI